MTDRDALARQIRNILFGVGLHPDITEYRLADFVLARERAAAERARVKALEAAAGMADQWGNSKDYMTARTAQDIAGTIRCLAQPPAQEPGRMSGA